MRVYLSLTTHFLQYDNETNWKRPRTIITNRMNPDPEPANKAVLSAWCIGESNRDLQSALGQLDTALDKAPDRYIHVECSKA